MKQILESLDAKIFTPEVQALIIEKFEDAKTSEVEIIRKELENDYADKLAESYEDLVEKIEDYTKLVASELKVEVLEKLNINEKSEKADAMIEGFQSMLITSGVTLAEIAENSKDSKLKDEVEGLKESLNKALNDKIELEKQNVDLNKVIVVESMKSGLDVISAEKLQKLASTIETNDIEDYKMKLVALKEAVDAPVAPKVEEVIVESIKKEESINKYDYSRYIKSK